MCGLDLGHYACACPPGAHVEDLTCTGNGMLIGDDRVNGVHSGNGNPVGMGVRLQFGNGNGKEWE